MKKEIIKGMFKISRLSVIVASIAIIGGILMTLYKWIYFFEGLALELLGWTILRTLWLSSKEQVEH